ncbi:hypothetical protein CF326_g8888 [Tilletia indica]|uniref:Uncharacterized protein n=1 Tax=Tilletia indica TaxID=43049 RepID=A0A8T8SNR5_9BASI|nr:hypothetical protein CF326_g8888 [Tilletia indica]KAE8244432.1 hypothetical protein A4X13_0g6600 [Tilletia indica]
MFVVIDLIPIGDHVKPSPIFLHPLLAPHHLDEFSLPVSFPVDAQAQLHVQDGQPIIYCRHRRSDVVHNAVRATSTPRRVNTGDNITILSSDEPTKAFVKYAVQVAHFSFSPDLHQEVSVELQRLNSASALALQAETSSQLPLILPLEGKLPIPAPSGTNWDGVRSLVDDVRARSAHDAHSRKKQHEHRTCDSLIPKHSSIEHTSASRSPEARSYAQFIAQAQIDSPQRSARSVVDMPTDPQLCLPPLRYPLSSSVSTVPSSTSAYTSVLSSDLPSSTPATTSTRPSNPLSPVVTSHPHFGTDIGTGVDTAKFNSEAPRSRPSEPSQSLPSHPASSKKHLAQMRTAPPSSAALALHRVREAWIQSRTTLDSVQTTFAPRQPPSTSSFSTSLDIALSRLRMA